MRTITCTSSCFPSARWMTRRAFWRGEGPEEMPSRSYVSLPVRCRVCASVPSSNWQGRTPIITRFERWMRSKLFATTAFTPRSAVPFAAQSRELPVPYSCPAKTTSGTPRFWYSREASWIEVRFPSGCSRVTPPSTPGTIRFLMRTLAKVPRTITSWFPRLADVRAVPVPVVDETASGGNVRPLLVLAGEVLPVIAAIDLRVRRRPHHVVQLLRGGPDVAQVDGLAVAAEADGILGEVDVDP